MKFVPINELDAFFACVASCDFWMYNPSGNSRRHMSLSLEKNGGKYTYWVILFQEIVSYESIHSVGLLCLELQVTWFFKVSITFILTLIVTTHIFIFLQHFLHIFVVLLWEYAGGVILLLYLAHNKNSKLGTWFQVIKWGSNSKLYI